MEGNYSALSLEELNTARAAIRVIRYLSVIGMAVAVPFLVVVATPLVGWALLAAIVLSPLFLIYVFVAAARQAEKDRRQAIA